jgi:hypothetical protein
MSARVTEWTFDCSRRRSPGPPEDKRGGQAREADAEQSATILRETISCCCCLMASTIGLISPI